MQQQLEDLLKQQTESTKAKLGSAVILDAHTGAIKAMANYPTYDPASFARVSDQSAFQNGVVSNSFEVGSVMKVLTAAAALDSGAVNKDQTYYDPSHFQVDDAVVKNIEEDGGPGTKSVADILQLSLNTGATWLLIQMAGAIEAVVNGGTYFQPHLVDAYVKSDGSLDTQKPKVVRSDVVSPAVSDAIRGFMTYTVGKNYRIYGQSGINPAYSYGGKTGTAQVPNPAGGYYDDRFNGTFLGWVGGDQAEYVIVVGFIEPHVPGYAGSTAAAPLYFKLANMLIDNFGVKPKGATP
jgi:cell division protein FtsI/penicillin-binding protein 2